ncbi:Ferrous iron transport protein B [Caulifigura coniformis]|uniref:Ferrous iron transport protein B n=1 Tax=Caulifigura coniformis TaxID=2527983 RepID=A0A517SCI6_9PLAN|nr:ferrous iron transport protein B [Caulifigura coniformis]QDT53825.1 Ferrous iron transport protein B [Caulifigura coniformis]
MSASLSPSATASAPLTVALIGNPNTGKSTLFSALSGIQTRIGNYPGCTVEKKIGRLQIGSRPIRLVDLPGTYSLSPRSPDEMVSVDVLLGRMPDVGRPDVIVCIVDASNLERNLYLFTQLRELGIPIVLALNMWDVAQRNGVNIDVAGLEKQLGVRVVTCEAQRKRGLEPLREAIVAAASTTAAPPPELLPEPVRREEQVLTDWLASQGKKEPHYLVERAILDVGGETELRFLAETPAGAREKLAEARKRLTDGGLRLAAVESLSRYRWIQSQLDGLVTHSETGRVSITDRIDAVVTHWFSGTLIFVGIMFTIFWTLFIFADGLMGNIEEGQGWVSDLVTSNMAPGTLRSLIVDGLINGVGSVIVFIPQIALLFLFIAILEDCGYLARAAYLIDRFMTKFGLSGRSFVPLMSSFACAIPGIMGARVIENRRDRFTTILIAPLMSCSARLPVYLLMTTAFVPAVYFLGGWLPLQALTLFVMYILGAVVAVPIAWLLKKTILTGETSPFVMELPEYKWPSPWIVVQRVISQAWRFLEEAGTLIFVTTILVWAAGYFPGDHTESHALAAQIEALEGEETPDKPRIEALKDQKNHIDSELLSNSLLGRTGKFIEPAVRPLGWDWRIGMAAVASFPAREVIIATMGTIFSLGGDVDEENESLRGALASATWPDGRPLFTVATAVSIMVFFALCAQCGATLMVIFRETGQWRWPVLTFSYMTALAYVAAWLSFVIVSKFT